MAKINDLNKWLNLVVKLNDLKLIVKPSLTKFSDLK